ncbi:MAG TPA: hypothetical protein VL362_03340 [Patescibacteria group bacterium]|jgi:hypothetical protein|nr:hypothetical protein [Patescibacteria group bacterium]
MRRFQNFNITEFVIIVVVVVIAGLLISRGYEAWKSATAPSTSEQTNTHDVLPQVKQKSDLDRAQKAVENVDPDSLDTSAIDQTLK